MSAANWKDACKLAEIELETKKKWFGVNVLSQMWIIFAARTFLFSTIEQIMIQDVLIL